MKDYSQQGEQAIILNYFKEFKGTFLDIGANDGVIFSNSHAIAMEGWGGVCVEPNKGAFERLQKTYTNNKIQCLNYCIGNENKDVDFFISDDSLISSVKESETEKWVKNCGIKFIKTTSQMITFASLLEKSEYKIFDFITIDVEGLDYDILSQIDLTNTKMICVEVNEREKTNYLEYCNNFDMKLIFDNNLNLIFTK